MLRFLSNYLFQNENQPNETDPTTTPINPSSTSEQGGGELQPGPKGGDDDDKVNPRKGRTKEDFMDFEEERGDEDSDEEEDEDDWVLIGDGEDKTKKNARGEEGKLSEDLRVQEQPANLVAVPSEPEKIQGGQDQDDQRESDDDDEEDEDDDEDEEEDEEEPGLLWENKLIEHPSMSVYVDLATSVNTNCTSMSSIAPATSPGESVIVLEHQDDEDEPMDIIEVAPSPQEFVHVTTPDIQEEMNPSDMENNVNSANISKNNKPPTATTGGSTSAPVQNGRRKKGHYPCTSSNSSQMPRRAHLRSGGNPRVNQTFQMISSNSWATSSPSSPSGNNGSTAGQILDSIHDTTGKRKRANNSANSTAGANATASACGIAIVGAAGAPVGPTAANNMINKNLKLVEMFPANAASVKKRQRHAGPRKANNTTEKGHFLQESKRRQDLQNHTKHSFVNNDRRSAQQRRVQKGAAGAGAAGSGARNTK